MKSIIEFYHSQVCGGHFSSRKNDVKILQNCFYWLTLSLVVYCLVAVYLDGPRIRHPWQAIILPMDVQSRVPLEICEDVIDLVAFTRARLQCNGLLHEYASQRSESSPKRLAKRNKRSNCALQPNQSLSSAPSSPLTPDLLPPILPLCLDRLAAFSPTGSGSFHSFLQVGQMSLPPCALHIFPTQCACSLAGHLSVGSGHR